MGIFRWHRERTAAKRAKVFKELSVQFLGTFNTLKIAFYELKEAISKQLNLQEIINKRDTLYEVYKQFSTLLEALISINKKWQCIDNQMGFFDRGFRYLFRYENNFDYDKALNTIKVMEPGLKRAESSLNELGLSTT